MVPVVDGEFDTDWLAVTDVEPVWDCVGDAVGLRVDEKL
jgi:hypothetical protein